DLRRPPLRPVMVGTWCASPAGAVMEWFYTDYNRRTESLIGWVVRYGTACDALSLIVPVITFPLLVNRRRGRQPLVAAAIVLTLLRVVDWATAARLEGTGSKFGWLSTANVPAWLVRDWVQGGRTIPELVSGLARVGVAELLVPVFMLGYLLTILLCRTPDDSRPTAHAPAAASVGGQLSAGEPGNPGRT